MDIRSLKRWHWTAVGALAGLALGVAAILAEHNEQVGGQGFISQTEFERSLKTQPVRGKAYVRSIVIRPTGAVDLVTLELLDAWNLEYGQVRFAAQRPYVPKDGIARGGPAYSVADYLRELGRQNPAAAARYAWWEEAWPLVAIRTLLGMVVVGGIWPSVLWRLVGFPPKRDGPVYQPPAAGSPPTEEAKQEMSEADLGHLAELEAEMIAGLASSASAEPALAQAPAAPPLRKLAGDALEVGPPTAAEQKLYTGEYYPVERKGEHAFTMAELLVVVGIITALLAILLPTIGTVREHALAVKCASNLRQIGAGLELYNQGHKRLPSVATPIGLNQAMAEMNIGGGIMTCPAEQPGSLSYAMNAKYAGMPKSVGNPQDVLASETAGGGRHGRTNTLFFDGHVNDQGGTP